MDTTFRLQYQDNNEWHDIFITEIGHFFTDNLELIQNVHQNYLDQQPEISMRIVKYIPAKNCTLHVGDKANWTSVFNGKQTYCTGEIKTIYPAYGIDDYTAYKVIGKSIITGNTIEDLIHEDDYSLEKIELHTKAKANKNGKRINHASPKL